MAGSTFQELPGVQPKKGPPNLSTHRRPFAQICSSVNFAKR